MNRHELALAAQAIEPNEVSRRARVRCRAFTLAVGFISTCMPALAQQATSPTTTSRASPSATADWAQKYGDSDSELGPPELAPHGSAQPAVVAPNVTSRPASSYGHPQTRIPAEASESDDSEAPAYSPPSVLLSAGLVAIDVVAQQPMVGGTAKIQVAATGRTRVGAVIVGLSNSDGLDGPQDISRASRVSGGALISQSLCLGRVVDLTGFIGVGVENYQYTKQYSYTSNSAYGVWIDPGISLDIMYRRDGLQLGGGPFFAVPYYGVQKAFGGTFGFQVFVGI